MYASEPVRLKILVNKVFAILFPWALLRDFVLRQFFALKTVFPCFPSQRLNFLSRKQEKVFEIIRKHLFVRMEKLDLLEKHVSHVTKLGFCHVSATMFPRLLRMRDLSKGNGPNRVTRSSALLSLHEKEPVRDYVSETLF